MMIDQFAAAGSIDLGGGMGFGGGMFDVPTASCGCSACAFTSGGTRDTGTPHVRGSVGVAPATDTRSYAILSQTRNDDGSWGFSGERNVDAVLIGSKIVSTDLTYTFPVRSTDYGSPYDMGQAVGLLPFNDMQQEATRKGFAMVASYTNLTFREITPEQALVERATFRLAQTTAPSVPSAMGNFPATIDPFVGQNPAGDIWFGRTQQPFYTNPEKGNWGYATILHEIGHTLGLKHGGDDYSMYDMSSLFNADGPVYGTRALEWSKDGQLWSLMTYSTAPDTRNIYNGDQYNQPTSYMMYDIAALQYMYGANYETNAGDTVYRWDERTGEGFVNAVGQGRPTGNKVLETIWDGGGNDTYDLSNYSKGVSIDLRPGATSVLSQAQLANAEAYIGFDAPMQGNVGNALLYKGDTRSLIENAIGGAGDDRIVGNQADNLLVGNGGNDMFEGMQGSDTILGGDGSDTVSFSTATTGIVVALNNGAADIRVENGGDVDTLRSIENIAGTAYNDVLLGDDGDNMLAGGAGGFDVLVGGLGNDRLIGGGYTLDHPDRPDVVKDASRFAGSMAEAVSLDGSFDLAPRYGVESASTIPHATVIGTVAQDGYEYFSFSGLAGRTVILDVDLSGGNFYPAILLLDADGNEIGYNFNSLKRDEGSRSAADPRLVVTLPADGVYYAVITDTTLGATGVGLGPLPQGFAYILNVSVEDAATPEPILVRTGSAYIEGGAGDDLLLATMGDDTLSGGDGRDTLSYEQSYKGVSVDLNRTGPQDTGAGRDTITGVENVIGSRGADRVVGDAGDNVIDGYAGQDTLIGGAGQDTLSFAKQTKAVRYDLAGQGVAQAVTLGQAVLASGFEHLTGSAFGDMLSGDAGANRIDGGAGDDVLSGDSLGRIGGVDTLIGGAGSDTASFAAFDAAVTVRLADGQATAGATLIATLDGIENVTGGGGNDWLRGDAGDNRLVGGLGDDRLEGLDGDDVLDGGLGDDLLVGGAGNDTAVFAGGSDLTIDLRKTGAQETGQGRDTLRGIENLQLGSGTNRIVGNGVDNIFFDGGGNDQIDGGEGFDIVDYSQARGRVNVDLSLETAQATGAGNDRLTSIEGLVGGNFRNRFYGNAEANSLVGGTGADTLIGGLGEDTIYGGAGEDVLMGDGDFDGDLSHEGRDDVIDGGDGWDFIVGGQGNDTLSGGRGNDTIYSGSNSLILLPNGATLATGNRLDGGNDVIDGGEGIDTVVLQLGGRTDALSIDLSRSDRVNFLYSDGQAVGSVTNIERALIFGGEAGDHFVGTAGSDQLEGYGGDDTLMGGLGDDYIIGGTGNDVIDGGEGWDTVDYGFDATGGVTLDLRITDRQNTGTMGFDIVRNIEQVVTSNFTDTVIGGDEHLTVIDDRGGDDTFIGNGGNDRLSVVRYASLPDASNILLDGGDGDDSINFLAGLLPDRSTPQEFLPYRDTVVALGGAGNDFMTIRGAKSALIDAGDGNDVVGISIAGDTDRGAYDITLGAGSDELAIQWGSGDIGSFDRKSIIVRDFAGGLTGDLLGLTAIINVGLFTPGGDAESIGTFSPFLSGHVTLLKQGRDTLLQVDKDGRFGEASFVTVMKLEGTNAFDFVRGNVYAYVLRPDGLSQDTVFYDPIITQYMETGQNRLEGHGGRDSLIGAAGDDVLVGLGGDDFLYGLAGNDTLIGGAGADYMVGGEGDDVYFVNDAGDYVQEQWFEGDDTIVTSIDWALGDTIENIESLGGGIRAAGNWRENRLVGSVSGQETLAGGYGDDIYFVRHAATVIEEEEYSGNDTVVVQTRSYTLAQGASIELMMAAAGTDPVDMAGNEFDQMMIANAGANRLDGGAGFDIVSYRNATAGVVVDGVRMAGLAGDAAGDRYSGIEGFQGSDFNDRLIAGAGGMTLDGRAGDDWLLGGSGNDSLFGGEGADVFAFDTAGVSGRDRVLDWSVGDRIATSKQLRGADASGLVTIGANALVLLDGTLRGDTAELVDQGGAVLRALGKTDGYWWYGFVSGADEGFDGRVTELAPVSDQPHVANGTVAHPGTSADATADVTKSPFYVYDVMGDAMASGVVLAA